MSNGEDVQQGPVRHGVVGARNPCLNGCEQRANGQQRQDQASGLAAQIHIADQPRCDLQPEVFIEADNMKGDQQQAGDAPQGIDLAVPASCRRAGERERHVHRSV